MGKLDTSCGGNCSSCLGLMALLVFLGAIGYIVSDDSGNTSVDRPATQTSTAPNQTRQPDLPKPIKNIARLKGNSPEELKNQGFEFEMPEDPNWDAGVVKDFATTSWKSGNFGFNGKGILTSVELYPKTVVNYEDAVKIMNQMGVQGEPDVNAPILWRWETPGPDLKIAHITKAEYDGTKINRFYIGFSIEWNQEKP